MILIIFGGATGLAYGLGLNSRELMGNFQLLWFLFALSFLIQIVGFFFAFICQTESFYDLTGSLTFISLTLIGLFVRNSPSYQQYVAALMILIWTGRLGIFLVIRIHKSGGDNRFD